jgi:xanthine/uracil permease
MSHLSNVVATAVTLVIGLLCGYVSRFFQQHKSHEESADWYYDLMGFGFGLSAVVLICAFVFFAYKLNGHKAT